MLLFDQSLAVHSVEYDVNYDMSCDSKMAAIVSEIYFRIRFY